MLIDTTEIDTTELEQLADEVAGLAGETRAVAVRRALEERLTRLTDDRGPEPIPLDNVEARLDALRRLRESLALTPEKADAWIAEIRAERMARRIPGDVDLDEGPA